MKIQSPLQVPAKTPVSQTRPIEAVLWDMDGTLIDSEPLHEATLISTLTAQGIEAPQHLNAQVIGLSTLRIYQLLSEEFGLRQPYLEWCASRQLNYLGRSMDLRPRHGALELFRELQDRGVKQGIVSNSDRVIVGANIHVLGLACPELVSISKNDVRDGKPSPEGYLRAAWLLGADPEKTLVIEDSVTGALAGIAAGMQTAYVPQASSLGCPSMARQFKDFNELKQFFTSNGAL